MLLGEKLKVVRNKIGMSQNYANSLNFYFRKKACMHIY